jgi:hypothetical protein
VKKLDKNMDDSNNENNNENKDIDVSKNKYDKDEYE